MEEQNQNWKDVVYEQDPEEKKQKKGWKFMERGKTRKDIQYRIA